MNSAAAANCSGFRGASTSNALRYSPCSVPKAISASGSSVATTLPATMIGDLLLRWTSISSHEESGVGAGSSESYFKLPLTTTRSSDAPSERIRSASFSLCRSEEHTSELQSPCNLVCRLLLEKKKNKLFLSINIKKKNNK